MGWFRRVEVSLGLPETSFNFGVMWILGYDLLRTGLQREHETLSTAWTPFGNRTSKSSKWRLQINQGTGPHAPSQIPLLPYQRKVPQPPTILIGWMSADKPPEVPNAATNSSVHNIGGSWHGFSAIKHLVVLYAPDPLTAHYNYPLTSGLPSGASYCDVGYRRPVRTHPHPTPEHPLGVEFPGSGQRTPSLGHRTG
jgi:hypothetical protein